MKNHKSYSTYICKYYWNNSCHYSEKVFGGSPASCHCVNDFENGCICFEPSIEYEKESSPYNLEDEKTETVKLKLDNGGPIDKGTLEIQNCDKIILKPKSLEVEVKIEIDNFDDFDYIIINGHKFKRV